MTALNLCTFAFTGGERVLQYYLICQTCSSPEGRVAVCLNCAAICHDQHEKHSLAMGRVSCECLQKTQNCKACSLDALTNTVSGDKRKRAREGTPSPRFIVWTQLDQGSKTVASSHLTAEEAGSSALLRFVDHNPWKYASLDELREVGKVVETRNENGSLILTATGEDGSHWRVGVDLLEAAVTGGGSGSSGSKNRNSSSRRKPRAGSGDTALPLSVNESSAAPHTPVKRAKNAPKKPAGSSQSSAATTNTGTGQGHRPDSQKSTPKRPTASFMFFMNATRDKVLAENPGIGVPGLSRLIGSMWKDLTASEKAPFEELARQDRLRYQREVGMLRNADVEECLLGGEDAGSPSPAATELPLPLHSSAWHILAAAKAGAPVPQVMSGMVGVSSLQGGRRKDESRKEEAGEEEDVRGRAGSDDQAPTMCGDREP